MKFNFKTNAIKIIKFVLLPIAFIYAASLIMLSFAFNSIKSPEMLPKNSDTKTILYVPSEIINIREFYLGKNPINYRDIEDTLASNYFDSHSFNKFRLFDECKLGRDDSNYFVWLNLKKYFPVEDTLSAKKEIYYLINVLQNKYVNKYQIYKSFKSYKELHNLENQYNLLWKINTRFELFEFRNIYDAVNLKITYYKHSKKNMISTEKVPFVSIELSFDLNYKDSYYKDTDSLTTLNLSDLKLY